MPEIWLGYGNSEIILDIKYENIMKVISPGISNMDMDLLRTNITNNIEIRESTFVLVTTPFPQMIPIIKIIHELALELKIDSLAVYVLSKPFIPRLRQDISKAAIDVTRIKSDEIIDKMSSYKNIILIDKLEYDPVFGFSGIPTKLVKECYPQMMNEIYASILGKLPNPGQVGEALKISMDITSKINCQMIHVISDNAGIDSVYFGDNSQSFTTAIGIYRERTTVVSDYTKSAFISGNTSYTTQMTLGDSLNLLWNNCHSVMDGGTIVLLSENTGGINEGAILRFIEGRLDTNGLNKYQYINDLEHINFLQLLNQKYEIVLISTLPQIYLNKLGLKSISKIKDGLDWILKKNGKYSKTNIIPLSEITMVSKPGLE